MKQNHAKYKFVHIINESNTIVFNNTRMYKSDVTMSVYLFPQYMEERDLSDYKVITYEN